MFILLMCLKRRRTYLYINRCCFCAYCTNYMQDIMCKCYKSFNICQSLCTIDVWLFVYKFVKYAQIIIVLCCCMMYSCMCSVYSLGVDFLIQAFYYSNLIGLQDFSDVKYSWLVGYIIVLFEQYSYSILNLYNYIVDLCSRILNILVQQIFFNSLLKTVLNNC